MRKATAIYIVGVLIACAFMVGFWMASRDAVSVRAAAPSEALAQTTDSAPELAMTPHTFRDVAKRVSPAVVSITFRKAVKTSRTSSPFWFFQDQFGFGRPGRRQRQPKEQEHWSTGGGTGFIIDKSGLILTNNHVVADADEIDVKLLDDREYRAEVVGRDPQTDVALIRIDAGEDLPVAALGDSSKLQVGDWVLAIGNPFGYDHSVTVGVVSAKGRQIGAGNYDRFIQTDASINPGNSGGPLINIYGEVIGINTAIAGLRTGIGFAVPINMATAIIPDLKEHGEVIRAWLGVMIQPITPDFQESLNLEKREGALVSEVVADSPAEEAGLEIGDVIIEFDGQPVKSSQQLPEMVSLLPVGKKVKLQVIRDGKTKKLRAKLAQKPSSEVAEKREGKEREGLGLTVRDLSPETIKRFGLPVNMQGAIVTDVRFKSPAERAGIKESDIILKIGWKQVKDANHFYRLIAELEPGTHLVLIYRAGNQFFVTVDIKDE
ncbi:DegQ family serine endoprotease [bacterium]|nr:DegQ family serine endoprotease [bacterium]